MADNTLRVVGTFLFWIVLGMYFAIAAAGGAIWSGFFALFCGWMAGRYTERPRNG